MVTAITLPMAIHPAYLKDFLVDIQHRVSQIPQVECPVKHTFSRGLYTREMFIPAGTVVVGKTHRYETLNIISMGDISVLTEKGMMRFKAPDTVISAPGIKKVGYAHKDTIWINVHPTDETDLDKIEEIFILPEERLCLGPPLPQLQLE